MTPTNSAYRQISRYLFLLVLFAVPFPAPASDSILSEAFHAIEARPQAAPTGGRIDVAFSPRGGATELVVKAISSAKKSILVAAYSFTSRPIAQALVAAHRRGIQVFVVVDKSQKSERYSSATFLANMGIPTRVDSQHKIMHDKFMVVDGEHVETGSFNYTASAERANAENVIVIWNNPSLANIYSVNWREHWDHSEPYEARY